VLAFSLMVSPDVMTSWKHTVLHFSSSPPTTRTVLYLFAIFRIGVSPQMN
jgi:hypothetical protein